MNSGRRTRLQVRAVRELLGRVHLATISSCGSPAFIVRNLIRLHGGWWDGYPSDLMPSTETEQAKEIASLAGGADRLVVRARELAGSECRACVSPGGVGRPGRPG